MNLNILKKKKATKPVATSLREKKHEANLRKNNGLYFQIGLIASLFIVFGLFQVKFKSAPIDIVQVFDEEEEVIYVDIPTEIVIEKEIEPQPEEPVQEQKPEFIDKFIEADNTAEIIEPIIKTEEEPLVTDKPVEIKDVPDLEEEVPVKVPFTVIEKVPVFPGCEKFKSIDKQRKCMSEKIARHINKRFDGDIAADNGLTGKQSINVMFTINTKGEVVDVKARAQHPSLEKEAIKAVNSLPKMVPGEQGKKKVEVTFTLPIRFTVLD